MRDYDLLAQIRSRVTAYEGGGEPPPPPPPPLPTSLPAGNYKVLIWLPDQHTAVRNNPRYAIRPANTTAAGLAWESGSGKIDLGHNIIVGSGTPGVTTKNYTFSNAAIQNPGRGIFVQEVGPDSGYNNLNQGNLESARDSADLITLVRRIFNLAAFRNSNTIPQWYLDEFSQDCATLRAAGMQMIMRCAYNYDGDNDDTIDTTLARTMLHVTQLAQVINDNDDVILLAEAGFVGKWGEWHHAGTPGDNGYNGWGNGWWGGDWSQRDDLVQHMLNEWDEFFITLRYARHAHWLSTRVSPASRLGLNNDSIMADENEGGTWDEGGHATPDGKAWAEAWLDEVPQRPYGGESASFGWGPTEYVSEFTALADFHLNHINEGYHPDYINWAKGTTHPTEGMSYWDVMRRKMGYQVRMVSAQLPNVVAVGDDIPIIVNVNNSGWAAPIKPRDVVVILRNNSGGAEVHFPLPSFDPRSWMPGAHSINTNLVVV